jgi:large subunit ribosomal protein L33
MSNIKAFTNRGVSVNIENNMAKKGEKRKLIGMVSEESGERIYYTSKNTMNTPEKLSLKKYSPKLRKHVIFTETKKNLGRNEVKPKK